MKTICVIYGTRPEAIKLAPVVRELKKYPDLFHTIVVSTGQQTNLTWQTEECLHLVPDVSINLENATEQLVNGFTSIMNNITHYVTMYCNATPDLVIVQGDTSTAAATALACHYNKIKVAHIEAGLRSGDKNSPFPEESNRILIDHVSDLLFPPTEISKQNLADEGITKNVHVVGNTIVDAFKSVDLGNLPIKLFPRPFILATVHRRENFGTPLQNICFALKKLADDGINILLPVHSNPNVKRTVEELLANYPRIYLLPPVNYLEFLKLESMCKFLMSDSGGVQEEAVLHLKQILILRNVTERPEVVHCGIGNLIGTETDRIYQEAKKLMTSNSFVIKDLHPFGDGTSSQKIVAVIKNFLNETKP